MTDAGIGTWYRDLVTQQLSWSDACLSLFGFPVGTELTYARFLDALHPDDRSRINETVKRAITSREPYDVEYRTIWPDRSVHWVAAKGRACYSSEGHPLVFQGIARDITRERRMDDVLREKSQQLEHSLSELRLALTFGRSGTFDLDIKTGVGAMSPEMEALYGVAPGTFSGTLSEWESWIVPEDLDIVRGAIGQTLRDGEGISTFRIHRRDNYELRWIEARAQVSYDDSGRPFRMIGVHIDMTERKRAEEAMQEANLFSQHVINSVDEGIVVYDRELSYKVWNPFMETVTGLRSSQVLGRSALHVFPFLRDTGLQANWTKALAGEESSPVEFEYVVPQTGRRGWASDKTGPFRNTRGEIIGVISVVSEITKQKQAEKTLRESQARLAKIFEANPVGINIFRISDNRSVDVNEAFLQIVGYRREEVVGHSAQELDLFVTPHQHDSWMSRVLEVKPIRNQDAQIRRKSGEIRDVMASIDILDFGGESMGLIIMTDISERKRVEEALRQSESQLQTAQAIARLGSWHIDLLHNRLTWSTEVGRIFSRAEPPATYAEFLDCVHPDDRNRLEQAWHATLKGAPLNLEHRVVAAGQTKWVHQQAALEFDSQGLPAGCLGTVQDITDRKQLEAQLHQAQKLEAVGQLAGGVAHDFNNILAAILMQLGLLRMTANLDEQTQTGLQDLETEARRATTLTRQLLMFSRRSVLQVRTLDLSDVIANFLKMLGRLIGEDIRLVFDSASHLPAIEADAGMMEQVLMNLVVNSRDAMPRGGRITISTTVVKIADSSLSAHSHCRPGTFVCLSVADTGTGMDEPTLKRIFEPFFTSKEQGKGTGLGLATVHGIVAQHQGWIEVKSQVGEGTVFRIYLPASGKPIYPGALATPEPIRRGQETILLVEDEPKVRRLVARTLRALGYGVHEAANGQEAMDQWQQYGSQVDLLFTDMVMPEGMTGLELVERLQALKSGLKAIISSGYSAEIVQTKLSNRTGIVYLPKPYETKVLAEVVRACLDGKG